MYRRQYCRSCEPSSSCAGSLPSRELLRQRELVVVDPVERARPAERREPARRRSTRVEARRARRHLQHPVARRRSPVYPSPACATRLSTNDSAPVIVSRDTRLVASSSQPRLEISPTFSSAYGMSARLRSPQSTAIATCWINPDARWSNRVTLQRERAPEQHVEPDSVPDCSSGPSAACVARVFSVCQKLRDRASAGGRMPLPVRGAQLHRERPESLHRRRRRTSAARRRDRAAQAAVALEAQPAGRRTSVLSNAALACAVSPVLFCQRDDRSLGLRLERRRHAGRCSDRGADATARRPSLTSRAASHAPPRTSASACRRLASSPRCSTLRRAHRRAIGAALRGAQARNRRRSGIGVKFVSHVRETIAVDAGDERMRPSLVGRERRRRADVYSLHRLRRAVSAAFADGRLPAGSAGGRGAGVSSGLVGAAGLLREEARAWPLSVAVASRRRARCRSP